jgi:PHD/YefM family antitoxin component YafN of YafNO toxin-antitoxin module
MVQESVSWQIDQFPVLYEHGQPTAVVVDLETFKRLELILDNLLSREPEPEDDLIAESAELKRLIAHVQAEAKPMPDWEQVINEL